MTDVSYDEIPLSVDILPIAAEAKYPIAVL